MRASQTTLLCTFMTTPQNTFTDTTEKSPADLALYLAEACWVQGDHALAELLIEALMRLGRQGPEPLIRQAIAQYGAGRLQDFWRTLARARALLPNDQKLASLEEVVSEIARTYTFDSKKQLMQIRSAADFLSQFPERGSHFTVCKLRKNGKNKPLRANFLSDVCIAGDEGVILDPPTSTIFSNSFASMEHSEVSASTLAAPISSNLTDIVRIPGHSAHLCGRWSGNFFHWMSELLPRAFLLQQAGFDGAYIVPRCGHAFIPDSLEMLGIPAEKIITNNVDIVIQCENLLTFDSFWFANHHENDWIMRMLRELLLKQVDTTSPLPGGAQGLYIMRKGSRSVQNHDEVQSLLSQYGIMSVYAEELSLKEQISLAARSRCIFGAHGSGLTLALFMPAESTVVEFVPTDSLNLCYSYIMHILNHRHLVVPSVRNGAHISTEYVEPCLGLLRHIVRRELGAVVR